MPRPRRHAPFVAVPMLFAVTLTVAGCGQASSGSSGTAAPDTVKSGSLSGKTAPQVYAAALAAARSTSAVHLDANLHQGQSIGVDLALVPGGSASGTFVVNGAPVRVVKVGGTIYARPSKAFLKNQGAIAKLFTSKVGPKWIKADASTAALTGLGSLTSYTSAAGTLSAIVPANATMSLVPGQTVNGTTTVGVKFTTAQGTGTLYVADAAQPYPMRLDSTPLGTITFADWGRPAKLTVPAAKDVIDLNKLSLSSLG